jgi:hypothetical protein
MYQQMLVKYSDIKFREYPLSHSQVVPCEQKDRLSNFNRNYTSMRTILKLDLSHFLSAENNKHVTK